ACRAGWLAFLDSDDLWYPQALQHFRDYIAAHPEATFIHGYRHRLNDDGSITESPGEFQDRVTGAVELFGRMFLSCLCVCCRRELVEKAGGYDTTLTISPDYDLYLRMSRYTKFWPLNKPTGLRRRHKTNISRASGRNRMTHAQILERFVNDAGGRDLLPPDLVAERLSRVYLTAAREFIREKNYADAITALERSQARRRTLRASLLLAVAKMLR
ncbi:MAG: hypothetical protein N2689_12310, partial [Verrucomicrobiae bacterium]|nr:hypothetical protein [Verrucomicrobiae bacterium]